MNQSSKVGILAAVSAYGLWGIAPIYFKFLHELAPTEILLHRIIWSFVLLLGLVFILKRHGRMISVLKDKKKLSAMLVASALLSVNWLLFIWAIANDKLLDASLGYYINPLVNVMLAMVFLGERLRGLQIFAVVIACVAVLTEIIHFGQLPWLAIALAATFGFYGLVKKRLQLDAISSLCLESGLMVPVALVYLIFIDSTSWTHFFELSWDVEMLILGLGIVTTVPLLCFNAAAKRISLISLGMIQYLGPTLMFGLAVALYNEPFEANKMMTFGLIWLALGVFSYDAFLNYKKIKMQRAIDNALNQQTS
ncbi:EamA family transporter RarD [Catenovulum sp. SM1970]|uniref:EamA family transporter RarD n=1 Tax=Marinifaba aquimaris TaxID=2741323 RepID=UPI001572FE95|nr:EamA family transporter RarD [Marinifaba aquimaris]NTS76729.1 EamA family transporter RarD [Marinifaba aquimaris]